MLQPGTVFQLKVHPNVFVAEASPRTPQEELQRSERSTPPKLVSRKPFRDRRRERTEEEGRKEGRRRKWRKEEGSLLPYTSFQI